MRYARKIDANQNKVVDNLRRIPGVSVAITSSLGHGFPDLVVGYKGRNFLIELKDGSKPPSRRQLTEDEKEFLAKWRGQYSVCSSFDDIYNIICQS